MFFIVFLWALIQIIKKWVLHMAALKINLKQDFQFKHPVENVKVLS